MLVQRMPVVVPARLDFLLLLVMIGLFGFIAQVSCILRNEYIQNIDMAWHKDPSDLGTATGDSRAGIFGYLPPSTIQATVSLHADSNVTFADHIRHDSRTHVLPLCALHPVGHRKSHHPYVCDLCCCKLRIVSSGHKLMIFQLSKTDAPGKAQNRGITLEEAEEAAIEEEDVGLEEADTSYIKLGEKKSNRTTSLTQETTWHAGSLERRPS
jgi:hypothetical protein